MRRTVIDDIVLRLCRNETREEEHYSSGAPPPKYCSLVVEMRAGPHMGFGECVPTSHVLKGWSAGKSGIDEWSEALAACGRLLGTDLAALGRWLPEAWRDAQDYNSIADALDFAVHDLAGRVYGLPVSALLGGRGRLQVPYLHTLFLDEPDRMAEKAAAAHGQTGVRYFKLKPSGRAARDEESLAKIKERVPGPVRFTLDPNLSLQGDAASLAAYLNRLRPLGLEICEDPLDADWATVYRELQSRTDVDLMVDARARTRRDIRAIIQSGGARWVNVHANWGGGFQQALAKADLAYCAGLKVMVGAARFLGIASAAYQILAGLLPGVAPCEQEPARMTSRTPVVRNEFPVRDGLIWIEERPGLGIEVDRAALAAVTEREERLT